MKSATRYRIPLEVVRNANARLIRNGVTYKNAVGVNGISVNVRYGNYRDTFLITKEQIKTAYKQAISKYAEAV
jgi:hypothetical protein